jgi:molybdopterin synthase sulfur carrier subunit
MPITVQIPTALRRHTDGVGSITCAASNLNDLFTVLDEKFPELKPHLRDDKGQIRRFLNIYVNEEDIRFLGGPSYAFQEGDEVLLVPSIAGGADNFTAVCTSRPARWAGSVRSIRPSPTGEIWARPAESCLP